MVSLRHPVHLMLFVHLSIKKINYYKLGGLQNWERNHKHDQEPLRSRIKELEDEIECTKAYISEVRASGKSIKIEEV